MLLAPIGALKLAALWFNSSPHVASVDASTSTTQPTPAQKGSTVALSKEEIRLQTAAASYAKGTRAQGFRDTPFFYEPKPAQVTTTPTHPTAEPEAPGVPTFAVQVIMASDTETKALIDGKVYRVGDDFRDGWVIAEIDSFGRTVTIADPATSRTSTRSVRLPGER